MEPQRSFLGTKTRFSSGSSEQYLVRISYIEVYQTINPLIYFNDRKSQTELVEMLSKTAQNSYPIDTRHTLEQDQVRFEDALGRIFPVPSEYDWTVSAAPLAFLLALMKSKLFLN